MYVSMFSHAWLLCIIDIKAAHLDQTAGACGSMCACTSADAQVFHKSGQVCCFQV